MSTGTDLRDRLHTAGNALPPPRVDAKGILHRARRRRHRRQLATGGGIAAVLAVVVAGALVLVPSAHKDVSPVTPADNVGSLRLGNVRLRPVIHHALLNVGDEVTVAGQHFWLRRPTEFFRAVGFCGGGDKASTSESCVAAGDKGRTTWDYRPATSPTAGSQAPMVFVGVTSLRLTYGLLFNKTGRASMHNAQTPYGTVFWGVLPREHRSKLAEHLHSNGLVTYGPGRVPFTTDALISIWSAPTKLDALPEPSVCRQQATSTATPTDLMPAIV